MAAGAGDDRRDGRPDGWGVLNQVTAAGGTRPAVTADAGYGDNTAFRLELENRGWQYVVAVKGTTSARPGLQAAVRTRVVQRPRWASGMGSHASTASLSISGPPYQRCSVRSRTCAYARGCALSPGHGSWVASST